jgi:hypothetical protein
VPTDAERDPVEWAQHTALVAISVFRTVLDLAEAAVADRDRLERMATTGRSFAESWIGDAARIAGTVASGFGFDSASPPASSPAPAEPAKRAAPRPRATPAKKKAATTRKAAATRPKPRKK